MATDSVVYGGSRSLAGVFALITFPIVARVLSPEELGQFAIIQTFTLLLVPLAVAGQDIAMMSFLSNRTEGASERDVNVTALAIKSLGVLFALLLACSAATVLRSEVSTTLGWSLFGIALLGVPAWVLFSFVLNLSKFKVLRSIFVGVSVLQVLLYTTFLLVGVVFLDYGVYGYALSTIGALLCAASAGFYMLRRQLVGGRLLSKLVRPMLRYGAPYALVGLLIVLLPSVDRAVLAWRVSTAEVGVYSVATRYAGLLELLLVGFKLAWWPLAFSSYTESRDEKLFGRVLSLYVLVSGFFIVSLLAVSALGIHLMAGANYVGATVFVAPLLLAGFFRGFQVVVGVGIALSKRSFWAPAGHSVGIPVGLAVIMILWPVLGISAAAWGVAAGELAALIVAIVVSRRLLPLNWRLGRALAFSGILLAFLVPAVLGPSPGGLAWTLTFALLYFIVGWRLLRTW